LLPRVCDGAKLPYTLQVQPPQRHPEQEAQPGHGDVAGADAHAGLGQVKLEPADVLERGGLGRSLQKPPETLTGPNVASLRACTELARVHVFDHTLTQRGDSLGCLTRHGPTPLVVRSGSGNFQAWYKHNGERRRIRPWPEKPIDVLGRGYTV